MELLKQHIEALLFCSEQSITVEEICSALELAYGWELDTTQVIETIEEIKSKYQSPDFSFELNEIADGYQFLTKKDFHATVSALIVHKAKKKLSVAQMETLAIIAYKQPVSKSEIEHIRGVNCDYAVQKLLEKDLIEIKGKSEGPGKPIIYATSQSFMDYFGIKSVKDLPMLKDLRQEQNEIGAPTEMTEFAPQFETVVPDTIEVMDEAQISSIAEVTETGETIILDEKPEQEELPDRKTIFLEHQTSQENESSETSQEDDSHLSRD